MRSVGLVTWVKEQVNYACRNGLPACAFLGLILQGKGVQSAVSIQQKAIPLTEPTKHMCKGGSDMQKMEDKASRLTQVKLWCFHHPFHGYFLLPALASTETYEVFNGSGRMLSVY